MIYIPSVFHSCPMVHCLPVDNVQEGHNGGSIVDEAPSSHSEAHPDHSSHASVTTAAASVTADSGGTGAGGVSQERPSQPGGYSGDQLLSQKDVSARVTQTSHSGETQRLGHRDVIVILVF